MVPEPDMAYAFPDDAGVTVVAVLPDKKRLPAFRAALARASVVNLKHRRAAGPPAHLSHTGS